MGEKEKTEACKGRLELFVVFMRDTLKTDPLRACWELHWVAVSFEGIVLLQEKDQRAPRWRRRSVCGCSKRLNRGYGLTEEGGQGNHGWQEGSTFPLGKK